MLATARALVFALAIIAFPQRAAVVNQTFHSLPACIHRTLTDVRSVAVTEDDIRGPRYDGISTPDGLVVTFAQLSRSACCSGGIGWYGVVAPPAARSGGAIIIPPTTSASAVKIGDRLRLQP